MLNKIFLGLFAIAAVFSGFFEFYGLSWLRSIGDPRAAYEGFQYFYGLGFHFHWAATAILLVIANVILWSSRRSWAMWLTFAYFAVFLIVHYFWVGAAGFEFRRSIAADAGQYYFSVLFGVVFVILGAAIVYLDQYLVLRLNDRMYPRDVPAVEVSGENVSEEER
ncbi:MAG: hypothetical protein IPK58_12180 [Acidobacteria bacterium]|nr:hypothetical protein [Acidobacteriota bacterium]